MQSGEGYWSEPYFDEGGGNILMTTFSEPVKGTDGKIAAIESVQYQREANLNILSLKKKLKRGA